MAITVVKNLTDISLCESATNWSGAPTAGTTFVREGTNSLGVQVSNTTTNLVYTGAPLTGGVNMTGNRIYVWAAIQGIPDTLANGGVGIIIGDGTNQRAYYVGGSDLTTGFQYGSWTCYVLDLANLPTNFATIAGASTVNTAAISAVGVRFKTVAKAQGTSLNCFVDAVRYGTGLTIYGGTAGAPGTFAQIVAADSSSATGGAYGIIRQVQTGVYGIQGDLIFGDSSGTNTFYFADTNATIVIEDHVYGTGTPTDINIKVVSNATAATSTFMLGTAVGSGDTQSGRAGVNFINANTTQPVVFDASNANVKNVNLYGCTFNGIKKSGTINPKFSSDATNGPNHVLSGCSFAGCSQLDIGRTVVRNLTVSTFTRTTEGALLWNSNINIKNSKFLANSSGSTTAAIEMPAAGTFTYDNLTFSGNDKDINYTAAASSGALTINETNGSNASTYEIKNATGNSVTINSAVTVSIKVTDTSGTAIQNARVAVYKSGSIVAGQELLNALTNSSGIASTSYNYLGDQAIVVRVRAETPSLSTPVNTTFTQGAGTLGAGTYYYRVSATNEIGETLASTETSLTITASHGVNVNWGAVTKATGYKVYGRSTGAEQLIASVSGGSTTTYLDGGSITPSGALPASNTTGTTRYVPIDSSGTITSSGFSATISLVRDTVASTSPI